MTGDRRRLMMACFGGGGGGTVQTGFLTFGVPSIAGQIYTPNPSGQGFITTNVPFNPGAGASWKIQVKIYRKTNTVGDIISTVNQDGSRIDSVTAQTRAFQDYRLYLSSNGTSWNLGNGAQGIMSLNTWHTLQLICNYTGSQYQFHFRYDEDGSTTSTFTVSTPPLYGKYLSFGGGFENYGMDCDIDLSQTKIWINDQLWWKAI